MAGMPQGSVTSPVFLIFFVANYPEKVELHTNYADDVQGAHSFTRHQEDADTLTAHAESVRNWEERRGLQTSSTSFFISNHNNNLSSLALVA